MSSSNSADAVNTNTTTATVTVEQAFALIHDGNDSKDKGQLWSASDSFCRASETLEQLATSQVTTATTAAASEGTQSQNEKEEEEKQICRLYREQSVEYRHRARQCFVRALEQEAATSKSAKEEEEASISDEEALSRIDLFAHLFSKPHLLPQPQPQQDITEQQTSLEERLSQLNDALPQGFKTSDERMRDINRGLNRLGLQLYSNSDEDNSNDNTTANRLMMAANLNSNKSEIEQVDDIIDQAKAEVAMMNSATTDEAKAAAAASLSRATSSSLHYSADSSSVSLDDDVASYFESMLAADEQNGANDNEKQDADANNENDNDNNNNNGIAPETIDSIRDHVADAQTSLAELMVLLAAEETQDDDDDSVVQIIDRDSARELLKQAGVNLVRATKELAANKS